MALSSPDPQSFASFDGTRIAYRELGEGRPVVLIHGYFSDAQTNWIRYGHAAAIAALAIVQALHGDWSRPPRG